MSTQKNTKDSIVFFIIGAIKPFKWLIVGQFIVTVIWAIDMSLSPYLIKVILNKITMILPSQLVRKIRPTLWIISVFGDIMTNVLSVFISSASAAIA